MPIERMPIATASGPTSKFRVFQLQLEEALESYIKNHEIHPLYELSDKTISESEFLSLFHETIGMKLIDNCTDSSVSSWDIELNQDRLQYPQFQILNSFNIMYYKFNKSPILINPGIKTTLIISRGEIFFTYREEKFKIISHFKPIVEENI